MGGGFFFLKKCEFAHTVRSMTLDKPFDIRDGALEFWRDLRVWCESMRLHASEASDYAALGRIQAIELALPQPQSDMLQTLPRLTDVLIQVQALSPYDALGKSLLTRGSAIAQYAPAVGRFSRDEASDKRFEALSARLFAMHRFFDGVSGGEDFGRIRPLERGDFEYGLGLRLGNGRLHEFFMRLKQAAGSGAEAYFSKFFDGAAMSLLSSLEGDAASFERYMQSHMVLRHDPIFSRARYELSKPMQLHLGRLAADASARRVQIGVAAGMRFSRARANAISSGVQSLRGFAMIFDLGRRMPDDAPECMAAHQCESEKCLSLADSVISRLCGMQAQHWQTRLESLFRGYGRVGDRDYEEKRFFGDRAADLQWATADFCSMAERISPRPKAGCHYIVRSGDRLRRLMAEAYGTSRDYRELLRQNPQIVRPEELSPGMKIYFPPQGSRSDADQTAAASSAGDRAAGMIAFSGNGGLFSPAKLLRDGEAPGNDRSDGGAIGLPPTETAPIARRIDGSCGIELLGEIIEDLQCMRSEQIDALCDGLNKIDVSGLIRTVCIENDGNICIACGRAALLVSSDENIERFMSSTFAPPSFLSSREKIFDRAKSAFLTWGRDLAARIRGDATVSDGRSLPIARLSGQKNRRAWVSSALRRLDLTAPDSVYFVMHGRERKVDVRDRRGVGIVQLRDEDFLAMRMQPWRRLSDYYAPPIVQMNALMQVWLGDLFGIPTEIGVPPLGHVNQYSAARDGDATIFRAPMGTPVYPIMRGRVVGAGESPECGKYIAIAHHDGLLSRYGSLSTVFAEPGMHVEAETAIGRSGCMRGDLDPKMRLETFEFCEEPEDYSILSASKTHAGDGEAARGGLNGKPLDYFGIVYRAWPRETRFDGIIEAE